MYLPPVTPSSRNLIRQNDVVQNDRYLLSDDNEDKGMINHITSTSWPQNTQMIKQKSQHVNHRHVNHGNGISKGNSDQLQSIGNIGLHLSDFETEVKILFFE